MPEEVSQDDIDKLLEEALGGPTSSAKSSSDGSQTQTDIDALLASAVGESHISPTITQSEEPEESVPEEDPGASAIAEVSDSGPQDQGQIDALLAGALSEDSAEPAAAPAPLEEDNSVASQDDIDALIAQASGGDDSTTGLEDVDEILSTTEEPTPTPAPEPAAAEKPAADDTFAGLTGAQSQDDIDALIAGGIAAATTESSPTEDTFENTLGEAQSQDDIDALIAQAAGGGEASEPEPEPEDMGGDQSQDDIDALIAAAGGGGAAPEVEAAAEPEPVDMGGDQSQDDIDALIAQASQQEEPEPQPEPEEEEEGVSDILGGMEEPDSLAEAEEEFVEEEAEVEASAPEPEAEPEPAAEEKAEADKTGFEDISSDLASALTAPQPADAVEMPEPDEFQDILGKGAPSPSAAANIEEDVSIDVASVRESLSLIASGTEIEGITGEIASLLGQLSERARRYQNAYQTGNQEVKSLRSRLKAVEKTLSVMDTERMDMKEKLTTMRTKVAGLEEERTAIIEKNQSEIATLQVQIRERENRISKQANEINALRKENQDANNQVSNAEVETRRALFELERVRTEFEAERQERARMQRVLETREKELQAMQAKAAGEASSLFMDELHRLVRRLESELNLRTSAARDALGALKQLRKEVNPASEAFKLAAKSLSVASAFDESDDEIKSMDKQADVAPAPAEPRSEKSASAEAPASSDDLTRMLSGGKLDDASMMVTRILSDKSAPPVALMSRVYYCNELRTPEIANHLMPLIMILRNLHEAQKNVDSTRGRENDDTEKTYVMMFDMLHYLVRIKAINKSTPEAWKFFLDIRGRYSFITADAQWVAYRDRQLKK